MHNQPVSTPTVEEEWRPVPGWPDYAVSNTGRVVSYKSKEPRELRGGLIGGYRRVALHRPDGRKYLAVHRLVALAFIGPEPVGMEVRHLDGDPLNCHVSNLKYGTHAENMQDRLAHGRHPMASKTHCTRGHEFTPENTKTYPGRVGRWCRACRRIREAEYATRKALAAANVPTAEVAA